MQGFSKTPICIKCGATGPHSIATAWILEPNTTPSKPSIKSRIKQWWRRVIDLPEQKQPYRRKPLRGTPYRRKPLSGTPKAKGGTEYMSRLCNGCGYSWTELPLDKSHALHQLANQAL